ncbi:hypothetical protein BT96DRAFT_930562 [Gymnopus androsaceus JB14]|uniref:Uncharacterized protein n=1 Tax=Gymnopus androsaceus JB14 TaxID=1447944 RepID=A0A6A4ILX3_9AGAR|nr:hypothetical protein BT96DRAFT_930562 [Gymnopus androsaceus JB14]
MCLQVACPFLTQSTYCVESSGVITLSDLSNSQITMPLMNSNSSSPRLTHNRSPSGEESPKPSLLQQISLRSLLRKALHFTSSSLTLAKLDGASLQPKEQTETPMLLQHLRREPAKERKMDLITIPRTGKPKAPLVERLTRQSYPGSIAHPLPKSTSQNLLRKPDLFLQILPTNQIFSSKDWDNIVTGKPARFNHVFLSMHATTLDERQTQKVGEVEFKSRPPVTGKTVNNSGDWQIVFAKYSKALTFVFPHQAGELEKYTLPEVDYHKVINYDKAIQYQVSQLRQYELH